MFIHACLYDMYNYINSENVYKYVPKKIKKITPSFHCPRYLKISSGTEMFHCEKPKTKTVHTATKGKRDSGGERTLFPPKKIAVDEN